MVLPSFSQVGFLYRDLGGRRMVVAHFRGDAELKKNTYYKNGSIAPGSGRNEMQELPRSHILYLVHLDV